MKEFDADAAFDSRVSFLRTTQTHNSLPNNDV